MSGRGEQEGRGFSLGSWESPSYQKLFYKTNRHKPRNAGSIYQIFIFTMQVFHICFSSFHFSIFLKKKHSVCMLFFPFSMFHLFSFLKFFTAFQLSIFYFFAAYDLCLSSFFQVLVSFGSSFFQFFRVFHPQPPFVSFFGPCRGTSPCRLQNSIFHIRKRCKIKQVFGPSFSRVRSPIVLTSSRIIESAQTCTEIGGAETRPENPQYSPGAFAKIQKTHWRHLKRALRQRHVS